MEKLPDDLLLESYHIAVDLKLSPDFISLIEKEIYRRQLKPKKKQISTIPNDKASINSSHS
jgi:developmental checkpoint coupling sporulation initiation to replication initiation